MTRVPGWTVLLLASVLGWTSHLIDPGSALAQAAPPAAATYQLTPLEMKYECPKLTGQMKVKIETMRSDRASRQGSVTSRTMQSALTPIFGGPKRGADPAADARADRAKLEAFNRRLAEKKCKTLDIDAELRGDPPAATPAKGAKTK